MDEILKITRATVANLPDSSVLSAWSLKYQNFPFLLLLEGVDSAQLEMSVSNTAQKRKFKT